jgi:hypothetical protein
LDKNLFFDTLPKAKINDKIKPIGKEAKSNNSV